MKDKMISLNKEQLDKLIEELPRLKDNENALVILTHLIENPNIQPALLDKQTYKVVREKLLENIDRVKIKVPYPKKAETSFKFIDLFAGIGGFRQALQNQGGNCVFSSEWDRAAVKTYFANYGIFPYGDIRKIDPKSIPDHDVLCAGFPCQPFSIAGVSKKNSMGLDTGFEDRTQGTLFFEIEKILEAKRPKFFFLENVKNILSHNKKKTIEIIKETFERLNYEYLIEVVNGKEWVPQHRERVFFIGYDKTKISCSTDDFFIPKSPKSGYKYKTLDKIIDINNTDRTLSDGTWKALQRHKAVHRKRNNGFGYSMLDLPISADQIAWTISARYYKDGADCLVPQLGRNPRQLSLKEVLELQGFDSTKFILPAGIIQSYKQMGNSVIIPAIEESAKMIANILSR